MKNVAVAIVLVLLTTAVYAATPEITPPSNGAEWMKLSSTEKLFWSIGYAQGYLEALNKIDVASGPNSACASLAAQKEAASHLIDQKVIRKAMEAGLYRAPSSAEASQLLQQVHKRFANDAAYRRELSARGLTEDLLKEHLLWQLAVLQFVSLRFPGSDPDAVNQQFFDWLDESRKAARIQRTLSAPRWLCLRSGSGASGLDSAPSQ